MLLRQKVKELVRFLWLKIHKLWDKVVVLEKPIYAIANEVDCRNVQLLVSGKI